MTNANARSKLHDSIFLIGSVRRRAAIRALAASSDPADTVFLAAALDHNHPNAKLIRAALQNLASEGDSAKIVALWTAWSAAPQPGLAGVLAHLGWPPAAALAQKLAREVLALATSRAAPETLQAVATLVQALPVADESWNDALHVAWINSRSEALEQVITAQKRQPGNPALEALHALVSGALDRYAALADGDGSILSRAFAMAPSSFRERMARVVASSTDRRLKENYRRALAGGNLDEARMIANLKLVGDEDGLFEKTRFLRLGAVLEFCERWATQPGRPTRPKAKEIVDQAVNSYQKLGIYPTELVPILPNNLLDIFEYWRQQLPLHAELEEDLEARDPYHRARGIYLGHKQELVDRSRLETAARSEHWLERLITRLIDPTTLSKAKEDPVLWVALCAGEGALFQTPIAGTPEDYHRHSNLLQKTSLTTAPRSHALLEILCAFQGAFVASGLTVDEIDEALDPNAIEIEEAEGEF